MIAILSAVALAAFDLMGTDRAQIRIDDTRTRQSLLRHAIVGMDTPVWGGEVRLSGFVADNGRLPENLRELVDPLMMYLRSGITPGFSNSLDDQCFQKDAGVSLGEAARLLKGHRGAYLAETSRDGAFRDGWGNVGRTDSEDALNFGWKLVTEDAALSLISLGADNAEDPPPPAAVSEAEADRKIRIAPEDWQIPLEGWTARLRYKNSASTPLYASDLGISDFGKLGLALLVFENSADEAPRWRQYRSALNSCDGLTELEDGGECVLAFTRETACLAGKNHPNRVPLGRHVLILTQKNSLSQLQLPDETRRIVKILDFFPGAFQPNLVLEMR